MRFARLLAISLSLVLFADIAAFADTIDTETFTISDLNGPLAGNTYTGSFSWDPSVSPYYLTAFSTDYPGWVSGGGTLADLNNGDAYYNSGAWSIGVAFYAPAPVGNTDAFAIATDTFYYGATAVIGNTLDDIGSGAVTYGLPSTSATPEPASWLLLATGAVGAFGAFRRKRKLTA
jgi:hypothetical protein